MKLISQFHNKYNNITYREYISDNGIKILHLDNPATIDFDFAIIFKAGCSFEDRERVPHGTAHFLEHMLLNPNSIFKSKIQIDRFEQGDKKRPSIYTNGYTTRKNIYFTCHANEKADMRILERMSSILTFSKKKFANQIEKERGIILAEKSRKPKREKDNYLMSLEFLFKGIQDEFAYDVLGEEKDIKEIDIDHLEKYFVSRFNTGNCTIAIQSRGVLKKRVEREIEQMTKQIPEGKTDIPREVLIKNRWRVGTFKEEKVSGINISFIYFNKLDKKIDYRRYAIEYIYYQLLRWLTFDILREKRSLIYDFSTFRNENLSYGSSMDGFRFTTEASKISEMLEELYTLLHTTSFLFLKSKRGREWFNDVISTYIFPRSTKFNEELAENAASSLLEDAEIYNANIAVEEGKKIKIADIEQYLTKRINTPPHIWIEADMKKKEMEDIIQQSSFAKEFKK
ncbi:MAG: M16 family metallopeptidase [Candidatus Dojkabacteria bacterium]